MFSDLTAKYRAGIVIEFNGSKYAFSRQYFMRHFVAFIDEQLKSLTPNSLSTQQAIELKGAEAYFYASQSLIRNVDNVESVENYLFTINGRAIRCPRDAHGYVYDDALVEKYPNQFSQSISYLAMAKHLNGYMRACRATDATVADSVLRIIEGDEQQVAADVVPVMIAALFLAEPKRNPSCFIPSLMLLELIKVTATNPFGDSYRWENCLQSPVLVNQDSSYVDFHTHLLYPSLSDLPTLFSVENNEKITLDANRKEFINAERKYNRRQNQKQLNASEVHMQYGGYFPNTHRFSYTELAAKRLEKKETLSDTKSFIIISDWLVLQNKAETVHQLYLGNKRMCPCLDERGDLLLDTLFPMLWERFMDPVCKVFRPSA